ncbi:MAB_1171c family putative transporter [Nocardia amamiensis]|uniref:MAB_1171c family putative transporter n=1 Tax=Nocardia amamiensis TaxID=404578 RepID=UPI000AB04FF5|nr:MAB_1171c family putative transporter [Nocardia amamiensis]
MSTVPTSILVVVGLCLALMTVGRWRFVSDTIADRLINRIWSWMLVAILSYEVASALQHPDLARRLFLGVGLMATASFYGLARLVGGADAEAAYRSQRRYDSAFAAVAVSVVLGTPIVHGALRFDYAEVVWTLSTLPAIYGGLVIGRACIRELRVAGTSSSVRLTYAVLLAFSVYWSVSSVIMIVRSLAGTPPSEPGKGWAVLAFLMLLAITLFTAIPLVVVLLARAGWDRTGRTCRRLRPLWHDLTATVPEVVLLHDHSAPPESAARLYRMTVEIWDALLHLKPYLPESPEHITPAEIDNDVRGDALRLARAVRSKHAGGAPAVNPVTRSAAPSEPRDRAAELRYLLELAREWSKVTGEQSANVQPSSHYPNRVFGSAIRHLRPAGPLR